jgi:hypothetical protein
LEAAFHPHVYNYHPGAYLTGQCVYSGTAFKEVEDHLAGNFLGVEADRFSSDAMVGSHDNYGFVFQLGCGFAFNPSELN